MANRNLDSLTLKEIWQMKSGYCLKDNCSWRCDECRLKVGQFCAIRVIWNGLEEILDAKYNLVTEETEFDEEKLKKLIVDTEVY